jgi:5-methylcytosine-specific restriction endonuclease McrA
MISTCIRLTHLGSIKYLRACDALNPGSIQVRVAPDPNGPGSPAGIEHVTGASTAQHFPALVLNADFRPLSYYPLSLWSWQDTIKAVFLDRVTIVSEYDRIVRSTSLEMRLPSVVALKSYVKPALYPAFTRFNVFLRDRFACQYCGCKTDLTFDHLVPRSRGGMTKWDNVITACAPCNLGKGSLSLEQSGLKPMFLPYRPTVFELHRNGRLFPPNYLHQSWLDYLYWDTELDP